MLISLFSFWSIRDKIVQWGHLQIDCWFYFFCLALLKVVKRKRQTCSLSRQEKNSDCAFLSLALDQSETFVQFLRTLKTKNSQSLGDRVMLWIHFFLVYLNGQPSFFCLLSLSDGRSLRALLIWIIPMYFSTLLKLFTFWIQTFFSARQNIANDCALPSLAQNNQTHDCSAPNDSCILIDFFSFPRHSWSSSLTKAKGSLQKKISDCAFSLLHTNQILSFLLYCGFNGFEKSHGMF